MKPSADPYLQLQDALGHIDPDMVRDDWVRIGMAIKSELGDSGFDLFDQWSHGGSTYDASNIKSTWKSINGNGKTTVATVYGLARNNGWNPQKKTAQTEQDKAQSQASVATKCAKRWSQAVPANDHHPYLIAKSVNAYGIKQEGENLLIPMQDSTGKLWSLQTIAPNGKKLFTKGGQAKGMYYRIPGDGPVVICEGYATGASIHEATGYSVAVTFSCGNLRNVARQLREKYPDERIILAADSEPQSTTDKARDVAQAISAELAIPSAKSDFNDLLLVAGAEAVKVEIDAAVAQKPVTPDLAQLAKLPPMEYDKVRMGKAKELDVRVGTLDKEVAKRRVEVAEEAEDKVVEELSAWPDPVDGAALLAEIREQLFKYVVMQKGCPTAAAVWALGSFNIDAFRLFPKLQIKSPEKRCGKSILMECLEGMTSRPLMTSNITASSLFRCIEAWKPTLLIDEADTFTADNDELNGIINAGHTRRHAFVIRTVKDNDTHKPRKFCVWGAQVIAGIKNQRDTLEDRSITIEMRRKKSDETTQKIPVDYFDTAQPLRRKCLRWATDNIDLLKASQVEAPPCGNDRAQDNWTPIFAIAAIAGGEWPHWVEAAYRLIEVSDQDDSVSAMLLADIKQVFDDKGRNRIHSEDLVAALVSMDDRPWAEWKRGFPMTKASLARLLKPYKIRPTTLRIGATTLKGYEKETFQDAFDRYLSPITPTQTVTTLQPSTGAGFNDFQSVTSTPDVTDKNSELPNKIKECNDVTDKNVDIGDEGINVDEIEPVYEELYL